MRQHPGCVPGLLPSPRGLPHAPYFLPLCEHLFLSSNEDREAAVAETEGWRCQEAMPLSAGHRGIQNGPPSGKERWTRQLKVPPSII